MKTAGQTPEDGFTVPEFLLSADELEREIAEAEQVSRDAEARKVRLAMVADYRSRRELGDDGFAQQKGYPSAVAYLEAVTRTSTLEARRRIALGRKILPRPMFGQIIDPEYRIVAAGFHSGAVNRDSAALIVKTLKDAEEHGAAFDDLLAAETALTEHAGIISTELLKVQAEAWRAFLDPDGVEPREDRAWAKRSARLGTTSDTGLTELNLLVPTIDLALITAAFAEGDKLTTRPRFLSEDEQAAQEQEPEIVTGPHGETYARFRDPRTPAQRHYDLMLGYFRAGLRSAETGGSGARSLATVTVTVTAKDLEAGIGVGWAEGISEAISVARIRELIDTDGATPVILGKNGQIVLYGNRQRSFSKKQRQAIAARDGDTCIRDGCNSPAGHADVHHVVPYSEGGKTEVDNGVLLCPPDHRWLTNSGYQMQMRGGRPWVLAPVGIDPLQTWRPLGKPRTQTMDDLGGIDWG